MLLFVFCWYCPLFCFSFRFCFSSLLLFSLRPFPVEVAVITNYVRSKLDGTHHRRWSSRGSTPPRGRRKLPTPTNPPHVSRTIISGVGTLSSATTGECHGRGLFTTVGDTPQEPERKKEEEVISDVVAGCTYKSAEN